MFHVSSQKRLVLMKSFAYLHAKVRFLFLQSSLLVCHANIFCAKLYDNFYSFVSDIVQALVLLPTTELMDLEHLLSTAKIQLCIT